MVKLIEERPEGIRHNRDRLYSHGLGGNHAAAVPAGGALHQPDGLRIPALDHKYEGRQRFPRSMESNIISVRLLCVSQRPSGTSICTCSITTEIVGSGNHAINDNITLLLMDHVRDSGHECYECYALELPPALTDALGT